MVGEINYVSHLPRLSPMDRQSDSAIPTNASNCSPSDVCLANISVRVATVVSHIYPLLQEIKKKKQLRLKRTMSYLYGRISFHCES